MQVITDLSSCHDKIREVLNTHGYASEHVLGWMTSVVNAGEEEFFFVWPDNSGIVVHGEKKEGELFVFSEPMLPPDLFSSRVIECLDYLFTTLPWLKKVWFELRYAQRHDLLRALPDRFHANPINYTLTWPVVNMDNFDPALPGGHWKSMRNARNKFYREHQVEIKDARGVPKEELLAVVEKWKKMRRAHDHAYVYMYTRMIDKGFPDTESARAMIVDGVVRGINAGWRIPNSQDYYGAIGLHDYSIQDLGLILFLEDMVWIKEHGFTYVDMGGTEKGGTQYKNQFLPERWYKTFIFSVVKK